MSFLKLALSFLASVLVRWLTSRQRDADIKNLGRAEAERDAAMEVAERAEAMNGVPLPEDTEVLRRLREGSA